MSSHPEHRTEPSDDRTALLALNGRAARNIAIGAVLAVAGFELARHVPDGNCSPGEMGPVPQTSQGCTKADGTWTPSTGASHAIYVIAQILSWSLIVTGLIVAVAAVGVRLYRVRHPKADGESLPGSRSAAALLTELRQDELTHRASGVGAIAGLSLGLIGGLIRGLQVHAATAPFAAVEIGIPAALLGFLIGLFGALLVATVRWMTGRSGTASESSPRHLS